MNLAAALKALAPAVGDGKIVPQHAYVSFDGAILRVTNGSMWASARVDDVTGLSFNVRHAALTTAMEREGARIEGIAGNGALVRVGRSRVTLRGIDEAVSMPDTSTLQHTLDNGDEDGESMLPVLSKFMGSGDAHVWQQGVHYMEKFAFAANAYAACWTRYDDEPCPFDFSVPSWAARFIETQGRPARVVSDHLNLLTFLWGDDLLLTSTKLNEEPADAIQGWIDNLPVSGGVPVPDNFKEVVQRLKSYGATRFRLADGKVTSIPDVSAWGFSGAFDKIEIEEEVDIDAPSRVWSVDPVLKALEYAETIDLTGDKGLWHGGFYHGVFQGLSG